MMTRMQSWQELGVATVLIAATLGCKNVAPSPIPEVPVAAVAPAKPPVAAAIPAPAVAAIAPVPVAAPVVGAIPGAADLALAPGNVAFVAAPTLPVLPLGIAPAFAPGTVQLAPVPSLALVRDRLTAAGVLTLAALAQKPLNEINAVMVTPFASASPDERAYMIAYLDSLPGGGNQFRRETWFVEGKLLGIFQRFPSKDGVQKQLAAVFGREADALTRVDKSTHTTWFAGDTVYFLRSGKKLDALLIATKAEFARWRQLEEPANNADKLYQRGLKAMNERPVDQATAQASLQATVAIMPYHTGAQARLAKLEYLRGHYAEAMRLADEALTKVRNPGTRGDLLFYRALVDIQMGDVASALKRLQEATSLGVKAPESTARLNALQGRYDKATLKIGLREFRCAPAMGMDERTVQVGKEFPGLTEADADNRLRATMDFLDYDKFTQALNAACGFAEGGGCEDCE